MAKTNLKVKSDPVYTHGGARTVTPSLEFQLQRSVMSCMLFEDEFYESGVTISERIADLASKVKPEKVAALAVKARGEGNLRHVPLWLTLGLLKRSYPKAGETVVQVIQRADELAELMAMYWRDDANKPLSNQLKKGLAKAFTKFDAYQLAKYRGLGNQITLRDVMFLVHPVPPTKELAVVYKKLADNELEAPKTWEKRSSAGEDKKTVFTDMIASKKLGALAMLRNLRGMREAGVDDATIRKGLLQMNVERVLPYQFITAAKYAPQFEPELEQAMFKALAQEAKLPGKTIVIVDVSGSMGGMISRHGEGNRIDAASGLVILLREICEDARIYATAGNDYTVVHKTALLPPRHGFALRDSLHQAARELGGGGIFLAQVMDYVFKQEKEADRIIVFTDEQDCDRNLNPSTAKAFGQSNYIVNVASAKNGIAYGTKWDKIDGFSSAVTRWISAYESLGNN
jgi:60 kDa SS-A/Ro ribonucleoprotein